jgi:hypothetical protein
MPDFEKKASEYIHTVPLAGLLVFGITVTLGSLFALRFEGVLFGIAAIFFPVITDGVVKLVFNSSMKVVNVVCFILGGLFLFIGIEFHDAFFVFFVITLVCWGVFFYMKFEKINGDLPH